MGPTWTQGCGTHLDSGKGFIWTQGWDVPGLRDGNSPGLRGEGLTWPQGWDFTWIQVVGLTWTQG